MAEQVRLSRSFSCRVKDDSEESGAIGGAEGVACFIRLKPVCKLKRKQDSEESGAIGGAEGVAWESRTFRF